MIIIQNTNKMWYNVIEDTTVKFKNKGRRRINSISYTITNIKSITVFKVTGNVTLFIVLKPHSYTSVLILLSVFLLKRSSTKVNTQNIIVIMMKLTNISRYTFKLNI